MTDLGFRSHSSRKRHQQSRWPVVSFATLVLWSHTLCTRVCHTDANRFRGSGSLSQQPLNPVDWPGPTSEQGVEDAEDALLLQLDKETGIEYVFCETPRVSDDGQISAPRSHGFVTEATVTFIEDEDQQQLFNRLIAPSAFVSSTCSFDPKGMFYGKVMNVEKVALRPIASAAIRINVSKVSPQKVSRLSSSEQIYVETVRS